jgi:regulator of CtrA degradation
MSTVSVLKQQKEYRPSQLAARMIDSSEFGMIYREVMELVEETAGYLDVDGRAASKLLGKMASVAYAKHSMEITTSCMRSASVCLALRATREAEMRLEDALRDVMNMNVLMKPTTDVDTSLGLPQGLIDLLDKGNALQARLKAFCHHLIATEETLPNAVHDSLSSLRLAFGTRF